MALENEIQSIIEAADIQAGFSAYHIESETWVNVNEDALFPMASVLKIPILAEAFRQLEQGRFRLSDRWTLQDSQKNRGSGILPFFQSGLNPTVLDILTLMMIISDNTATDMTIDRLGGPPVIEQAMRDLGLTKIFFKLTVKELLDACLPPDPKDADDQNAYPGGFKRDAVSFSHGPDNDTSTAKDMTRLVTMIYQAEIVPREASDQMLDILFQQQFNGRLPRFLPRGTKFAHKTGTLAGTRNDSGLMVINDNSHVALTLFTKWDDQAVWGDPVASQQRIFEVETAMGKIGRLLYDHFS